MIASFRSEALRRFLESDDGSRLNVRNHDRVRRILALLDAAEAPEDMSLPGFYFHAHTGSAAGRYSLRVTGNWRITFAFDGRDAVDVDLEDYH